MATPVNNWDDAKAKCEAKGEKLAVFTSKESVAWANDKKSVAWMNDRASTGIHYEANYFYHHLINLVFTTHSTFIVLCNCWAPTSERRCYCAAFLIISQQGQSFCQI